MLELVFVACTTMAPEHCEDHSLLYADVSLMQCMLGAQTVLAPWAGEHPGWRIERDRCQYLDERVTEL